MPTDPNFPNRPDHQDFYALALTVQDNDHAADTSTEGMFDDMISRHVDRNSLIYMAQQRALRTRMAGERTGSSIDMQMISLWIDGFMAGVNFDFKRHAFTIVDATKPRPEDG